MKRGGADETLPEMGEPKEPVVELTEEEKIEEFDVEEDIPAPLPKEMADRLRETYPETTLAPEEGAIQRPH